MATKSEIARPGLARGTAPYSGSTTNPSRTSPAQDVVCRQRHVGEVQGAEGRSAGHQADARVRAVDGVSVDRKSVRREIHQPSLWNAGAGVEGHLDVAVIGEERIRDFDDQQRVGSAGVVR